MSRPHCPKIVPAQLLSRELPATWRFKSGGVAGSGWHPGLAARPIAPLATGSTIGVTGNDYRGKVPGAVWAHAKGVSGADSNLRNLFNRFRVLRDLAGILPAKLPAEEWLLEHTFC